jgi:hypothetical protein
LLEGRYSNAWGPFSTEVSTHSKGSGFGLFKSFRLLLRTRASIKTVKAGTRAALCVPICIAGCLVAWSKPAAQTFSSEVNLSLNTPLSYYGAGSPQLAISSQDVIAVWDIEGTDRQSWWKYSPDDGITWTQGGLLDAVERVDRVGNLPTVCSAENGIFFAATLYSRRGSSGGNTIAIYRGRADSGTFRWSTPELPLPFFRQPDASTNTELDLPSLACDSAGENVFVAFVKRESNWPEVRAELLFSSYEDSAWSTPQVLGGPAAEGPKILIDQDQSILVIWFDMATSTLVARRSVDGGRTFGDPSVLTAAEVNYSFPPAYDRNYGRVNGVFCGDWAPVFHSVAVDRSQGPWRGRIYIAWPEHVTGDTSAVTSQVNEQEPNNDASTANRLEYTQEVRGVSVSPDVGNGIDYDYFYMDGIVGETILLSGVGYSPSICVTGFGLSTPGIYYGGTCLSVTRLCPPAILTLPKSGQYYASLASGGRENIVYRIRAALLTPSSTSIARDHRDVVLVWSDDGGRTWSPKVRVNDDPPRFDNALPEVTVDDLGRVHVAWYDRRDDPEHGVDYCIYWTWSNNGGHTFEPATRFSEYQAILPTPYHRAKIGDHMGLCGTVDGVVGAWTFATTEMFGSDKNQHDVHARFGRVAPDVSVSVLATELKVNRVRLSWSLSTPQFLERMEIQRRPAGLAVEFLTVGAIDAPSSQQSEHHAWEDTTIQPSTTYEYRIRLTLLNGEVRLSVPVVAVTPSVPTTLSLRVVELFQDRSRPLKLELLSPVRGDLQLNVFDVEGSLVRRLASLPITIGENIITWDKMNTHGFRVPHGIYLIEATVSGYRDVIKVTL